VLPSLLPEFVPNLALFAFLPEPKLKLALESAERALLWDGRISSDQRRLLLQQVQVLARKATHVTQLKALATLAKITDGIVPKDLVRLSKRRYDQKTLESLLWIKQQAIGTLQQMAQGLLVRPLTPPTEEDPLLINVLMGERPPPARTRYLYAHYLLWTLGQPHDYRLEPLFWSYQAFQWYFKARFFYLLGRGMYDTFHFYWNQWQCERQGKLWSYFNERAQWTCTVCGDLPIFYPDTFTDKSCLEAYLKNPQQELSVIKLIQRLNWQTINTLDFSNQIKWSEQDWIDVFSHLPDRVKRVRVLCASSAIRNNALPFTTRVVQALADFLNNSSVTTLSLAYRTIGDKGTKILTSALPYSEVRTLNLKWNNISDEGIKTLVQFLNQSPAQTLSLDLEGNNIGAEGACALAQSLNQSQMQTLSLDSNHIGAKGASALAQSLIRSQVKTLSLWTNNIGDEGISALAQFLNQSQIDTLYLGDNNIGAKGASALAQSLIQSKIKILSLDTNHVGAEGAKIIAQFLKQSQVQTLDLWGNNIRDEGTSALAQSLNQSQVETLSLGGNNIGDEGVIVLAQYLNQSQVKTLSLNRNSMSAKGVSALAQSLSQSQVKILGLNRNNIGPEGAKVLAQFLKQSQVEALDLWSNHMGAEGARALVQSLNQSQVKILGLDGNNIGDDGISVLAQFLKQSLVQTLSLNSNNIGVEGIKVLAQSLSQSSVQTLYLSNNNIGDAGVRALAPVLSQSLVQTLYLHGNSIGDAGVIALAKILVTTQINFDLSAFITPDAKKALAHANANTLLEVLNLEDNKITHIGATALCRILPQTRVAVTRLNLNANPINSSQVDPQTCFIPNATPLRPSGPVTTLYRFCQATLRQVMEGCHMTARWLTLFAFPSSVDPTQDQCLSSLVSTSNTVKQMPPNTTTDVLPEEIIIHDPSLIHDAPSEMNENEPLFTFKITSTDLVETTIVAASKNNKGPLSQLWEIETAHGNSQKTVISNQPSKNHCHFFSTLAKTSSSMTPSSLNPSFLALSKPNETLSTVSTLSAVGVTVGGMLAVGYWIWKNIKKNNKHTVISENQFTQPEVTRTPNYYLGRFY
jgi:Ran GTPase-activating protein (RanGAP) involved in mRNA processing and transport